MYKNFIAAALTIGAVALMGNLLMAASPGQPGNVLTPEPFAQAAMRACAYPSGGWTTIDSDNGAAANVSAALTLWTTYNIQCDDNAYVAWGDSTVDADTSDGWLAAGAIVRFTVLGGNNYVAVQNKVDATADCHYIECR